MEIVEEIEHRSPLDLLWDNICLKYAAILRAQKLLYVKDRDDHTGIHNRHGKSGDGYAVLFSQDKEAAFLSAQSRAMQVLTGMIKQYEEMCHSGLATKEQKLRIKKMKMEIRGPQAAGEDDGLVDALKKSGDHIWDDNDKQDNEAGESGLRNFQQKQMQVFTWWCKSSPYKDHNGIIADGSIRAGKTVSMAVSFIIWAWIPLTVRILPCAERQWELSEEMYGNG